MPNRIVPIRLGLRVEYSSHPIVRCKQESRKEGIFRHLFSHLSTLLSHFRVQPMCLRSRQDTRANQRRSGTYLCQLRFQNKYRSKRINSISGLLPSVINILSFKAPLPRVISFTIQCRTVYQGRTRTIYQVMDTSISRRVFSFPIRFRAFPLSIFIRSVFKAVISHVLRRLNKDQVRYQICPSPFTSYHFRFKSNYRTFIRHFSVVRILLSSYVKRTNQRRRR